MANLEQYLLSHLKDSNESMKRLEIYAKQERIPIMDPVSINFLMQLVRLYKPKHILEIGTAIGYSALKMHKAYPNTKITTIERNERFYNKALHNINEFNKEDVIHVIYGDALSVLKNFTEQNEHDKFDFVFIDAAKAKYKDFFKLAEKLLTDQGVIISDNILFKGLVAESKEAPKRLKQLATKIKKYNKWLSERNDFATSFVPIGDGVAISVRI